MSQKVRQWVFIGLAMAGAVAVELQADGNARHAVIAVFALSLIADLKRALGAPDGAK
jgi:hypothetical protein